MVGISDRRGLGSRGTLIRFTFFKEYFYLISLYKYILKNMRKYIFFLTKYKNIYVMLIPLSFLIKIKLVYECAFVIPMVDKCHKVVKYLLCFIHFD